MKMRIPAPENQYQKFYLSIKRVMESSLSEEMKNAIVMAYITELENYDFLSVYGCLLANILLCFILFSQIIVKIFKK